MSDVEVRTFEEPHRAALRALFGRAGEGAPTASIWGDAESEADVYLTPYMDQEPESLFVAVEDGSLVGYLAGCRVSSTFPSEEDRIRQAISKHRLFFRRKPAVFFARAILDTAICVVRREPTAGHFDDPRWPAQLHINVLPRVRGAGVGPALMSRWLNALRETGSPGCHLQTLVENHRAARFFERMGFEKYGPAPIVPGLRYQGKRVHQQTMVWTP